MSRAPAPPRPALLLLAYLAFVSLGLPDGLIGVGWPSIRLDLDVPTEAVGVVLTAGTVAYLTSSVLAGFTLARLGVGWLLAGSTLLAGVALTGYASSPALAVMVGFALVLGLGSGAIDAGLNAYAAAAFGPRHMNWMHAFFGLGVAIGPLIMTAVLGAGLSWRWGYALVAVAQLALAAAFALTVRLWRGGPPAGATLPPDPVAPQVVPGEPAGTAPAARRASIGTTLRLPAVWLGGAAFAVYVAIEVSTGLWAFLLLTEGRGLSAAVAGLCVSGYWGSLFVGAVTSSRAGCRGGRSGSRARRRSATKVRTAPTAPSGGSAHRSPTSRSTGTIRPRATSRRASTARCRAPFSATGPRSPAATSGPSTPKVTAGTRGELVTPPTLGSRGRAHRRPDQGTHRTLIGH
ncbi:MFS transporter [Micromonospora sp. I033]